MLAFIGKIFAAVIAYLGTLIPQPVAQVVSFIVGTIIAYYKYANIFFKGAIQWY